MARIHRGRIGSYKEVGGFGFIYEHQEVEGTKKFSSWFFHIRSCDFEPAINTRVTFEVGPGAKGPMAVNIHEDHTKAFDALAGKKVEDSEAAQ